MRAGLPNTHPWKKNFFTLRDWHDRATTFVYGLDAVIWIFLILVMMLLLKDPAPVLTGGGDLN